MKECDLDSRSYFLALLASCLFLAQNSRGKIQSRKFAILIFPPKIRAGLAEEILVVVEGEPLEVKCPVAAWTGAVASCELRLPGFNSTIAVSGEGGTVAAGHSWTPLGDLSKGECGVRLGAARRRHAGRATCSAGKHTSELQIEVIWPPSQVLLLASNKFFEFTEGENMNFSCSSKGGSPHANVSILLGNILLSKLKFLIFLFTFGCKNLLKSLVSGIIFLQKALLFSNIPNIRTYDKFSRLWLGDIAPVK